MVEKSPAVIGERRSPSEVLKRGYADEEVGHLYELGRLCLENGDLRRGEIVLSGITAIAPDTIPATTPAAFAIGATTGQITVGNSAVLNYEKTKIFTLTVEVSDGSLSDTATVTINLNDVNDVPVGNVAITGTATGNGLYFLRL